MDLREAREAVVDRLIETDTLENYPWVLLASDDNPGLKAARLTGLAGNLSLWDEAEILSADPTINNTPFASSSDDRLSMLGIHASQRGDLVQARVFFSKVKSPTYDPEVHIVDGMITHGHLEDAEAVIRETNFDVIENGGMQRRLGGLVYALCQNEGGPKYALNLVLELVPIPDLSDIKDKVMERSRMDYFIEYIPVAAIKEDDFKTAETAIEFVNNWIGASAAMGGGGLMDDALRTEDPSIIAGVKALFFKKWKVGDPKKYVEENLVLIRPTVVQQINRWISD